MRNSPSFQEKWSILFHEKEGKSPYESTPTWILWEMPAPVSRVERDKDAKIKSHFTCAVPHERYCDSAARIVALSDAVISSALFRSSSMREIVLGLPSNPHRHADHRFTVGVGNSTTHDHDTIRGFAIGRAAPPRIART